MEICISNEFDEYQSFGGINSRLQTFILLLFFLCVIYGFFYIKDFFLLETEIDETHPFNFYSLQKY